MEGMMLMEGCWFLVSSPNVSLKTPVLHQDQISQRAAIAANATQSCKRQDSGIDFEIQGAVVCFPHAFISYPSVRLKNTVGFPLGLWDLGPLTTEIKGSIHIQES